jgi:hypothetical protein
MSHKRGKPSLGNCRRNIARVILVHALCWVHAERALRRLPGNTVRQRQNIEEMQQLLWDYYPFVGLKKTCRKLGISFWHFLISRLRGDGQIPPLPEREFDFRF